MKYIPQPAAVEAVQWTGQNADEVQAFLHNGHPHSAAGWVKGIYVEVGSPIGLRVASEGDWIIKDANGDFTTCKPDIFAATYSPVDISLADSEPDTSPMGIAGTTNPDGTVNVAVGFLFHGALPAGADLPVLARDAMKEYVARPTYIGEPFHSSNGLSLDIALFGQDGE